MKCPSCDNKPLGLLHYLKKGGVSVNHNVMGYFRCQHCDTLLKQKRFFGIFTKFELPVLVIFPVLIFGVLFLPEFILYLAELIYPALTDEARSTLILGITITTLIGALPVMFLVITRYLVFEPADEKELEVETKVKPPGQILFLIYLIIALLSTISIIYFIDFLHINEWILGLGFMAYLITVIGIGSWIINQYSESETASE